MLTITSFAPMGGSFTGVAVPRSGARPFGFDPDGGNGTAEWWIVAVLAVITVAAAALAHRDLRVVRRRASVSTP